MSEERRSAGATWVGRAIRRLEDPALVTGRGRFTADLKAAHSVKFVRSPVASGRIERIVAPEHAMIITAADLAGVKPLRPLLHKFNYIPIEQPILADGCVRFVGEPMAAVVAASEAEAEDLAERLEVEIAQSDALVDACAALREGAPAVHAAVPTNVIVEGQIKTPDFDQRYAAAHRRIRVQARSRRQNATPLEARGGHAAF